MLYEYYLVSNLYDLNILILYGKLKYYFCLSASRKLNMNELIDEIRDEHYLNWNYRLKYYCCMFACIITSV